MHTCTASRQAVPAEGSAGGGRPCGRALAGGLARGPRRLQGGAQRQLSLQVHGVLRMPAEGVASMGAVTIITHIGRIVIDGWTTDKAVDELSARMKVLLGS